jgi:hypothetical protein
MTVHYSGGSVDQVLLTRMRRLIFWTSGVLLTVKAWFGASLKHLNKPNIAFIADGYV